jgi:hypothetical protein
VNCTLSASFVTNTLLATSLVPRAAITIEPGSEPTTSMTCCYLGSENVAQIIWYTSSIEITVATVSTIVYRYNDTAVTSYSTTSLYNEETPLPSTLYGYGTNPYGVPTDIVGPFLGPYLRSTELIYGTAFTDPYGAIFPSPTPVWVYIDATIITDKPIYTNNAWECPPTNLEVEALGEHVYIAPSGESHYFLVYNYSRSSSKFAFCLVEA